MQQGLNTAILCHSAGFLDILRKFRTDTLVTGTRVLVLIDDTTAIFWPKHVRDTTVITRVTSWLQEHLALGGIHLNCSKSHALLAGTIAFKDLPENQCEEMVTMQLKIIEPGIQVVEVPAGTKIFQRHYMTEAT